MYGSNYRLHPMCHTYEGSEWCSSRTRGAPINKHVGNINFRNIVRYYKEKYLVARDNYEKDLIAMEVKKIKKYALIRIIRLDSKSKTWIEVDDK